MTKMMWLVIGCMLIEVVTGYTSYNPGSYGGYGPGSYGYSTHNYGGYGTGTYGDSTDSYGGYGPGTYGDSTDSYDGYGPETYGYSTDSYGGYGPETYSDSTDSYNGYGPETYGYSTDSYGGYGPETYSDSTDSYNGYGPETYGYSTDSNGGYGPETYGDSTDSYNGYEPGTYGPSYSSYSYYGSHPTENTRTVTLYGNFTLTGLDWNPQYGIQSSIQFMEQNATVSDKVMNQSTHVGSGSIRLYFSVLRFSRGSVLTEYIMVLTVDSATNDQVTDDTIIYLDNINGFEQATVTELIESPMWMSMSHSYHHPDYSGWIHPSHTTHYGYYTEYGSGYMSSIILYGNVTLTSENWTIALGDHSSPDFQQLNSSATDKIASVLSIDHVEFFEILRFCLGSVKAEIAIRMGDGYQGGELHTAVIDVLNSVDGLQDAVITGTVYQSGVQYTAGFSYGYGGGYGNYRFITLSGYVSLPMDPWTIEYSDNSSSVYGQLNVTVVQKVLNKASAENYTNIVYFTLKRVVGREVAAGVTIYFEMTVWDNSPVGDIIPGVINGLNGIEGFQDANVEDFFIESGFASSNSGYYTSYDSSFSDFFIESGFASSNSGYYTSYDSSFSDTISLPIPMSSTVQQTVYIEPSTAISIDPSSSSSYFTEQTTANNGPGTTDMPPCTEIDVDASIELSVVNTNEGPKIALFCGVSTATNCYYSFEWFADNVSAYNSAIMSEENANTFYVISDQMDVSGFALEKEFKCAATVYSFGTTQPVPVGTNVSPGIHPFTTQDTEWGFHRGQSLSISFYFDLPLPCQETCYVDIQFIDLDEDNTCSDSGLAYLNAHTCGQRIYGSSNYSQKVGEVVVTMTTINNNWFDLKSRFNVILKFKGEGQVESFWTGQMSNIYTVNIDDSLNYWMGAVAYSMNDPSILTWEFQWVRHYGIGVYTFYKNTQTGDEVQIATEYCLFGGVCTCGVIIRSGLDIFVVDHCAGFHSELYLQYSGHGNLVVINEFDNYYEVHLPRGTVVAVQVSVGLWFDFTMINVFIFPSPNDVNNVKGLCGTLNGNMYDDLTHSTGEITLYYWWSWEYPESFIESWRVLESESLFNQWDSIELQDTSDTLNTCTPSGIVIQNRNEMRTCMSDTPLEVQRRSVDKQTTKRMEKREVVDNMMDKRALKKRMTLRNERRSRMLKTRQKREVDPTDSCTFEEAMTICRESMNAKCGSAVSENSTIVNNTDKIRSCAADKNITGCSASWENTACAGAIATVQQTLNRNTSVDSEEADNVRSTLCPNYCCDRGTCVNGVCQCNQGYHKTDCSFDQSIPANIIIDGSEQCEIPCNSIRIMTDEIYDGTTCQVSRRRVTAPDYNIVTDDITCNLGYINTHEAYVTWSDSSRRRRSSTTEATVVANIYDVSLSNDGATFGNSSPIVELDSTCLNYTLNGDNVAVTLDSNYCLIDGFCYLNGTTKTGQTCNLCHVAADAFGWTLISGNCLIDDVCYTNGTLNSGDTCRFCHVTVDTIGWTLDNGTESCLPSESSGDGGMEGYVIAIVVLVVLLAVGAAGVGGYFLWSKYLTSRTSGLGLFDTVRKQRFTLRVEPNKEAPVDEYSKEDHLPPNLYPRFAQPLPGSERIPANLYSDRRNSPRLETPEPVLALPGSSDQSRAHTPNMPNIDQ